MRRRILLLLITDQTYTDSVLYTHEIVSYWKRGQNDPCFATKQESYHAAFAIQKQLSCKYDHRF